MKNLDAVKKMGTINLIKYYKQERDKYYNGALDLINHLKEVRDLIDTRESKKIL